MCAQRVCRSWLGVCNSFRFLLVWGYVSAFWHAYLCFSGPANVLEVEGIIVTETRVTFDSLAFRVLYHSPSQNFIHEKGMNALLGNPEAGSSKWSRERYRPSSAHDEIPKQHQSPLLSIFRYFGSSLMLQVVRSSFNRKFVRLRHTLTFFTKVAIAKANWRPVYEAYFWSKCQAFQ